MKKIAAVISILLILSINSFAQLNDYYRLRQNEGLLGGGFGITWIDGQPFYSFRLFPELQFKNVGVGLDFKMEFGADGKVRTENFNEFSDYLSIIRYVRYGYKNDPLYVRVGALDYATLGHGSIMYLYKNSPSYDTRKIGLEFDIDFTNFGFETVYGNFGQAGIIGLRGYVRPLQFTEARTIPILGNLEVGASLVSDVDDKAGVVAGTYNSTTQNFNAVVDEGATTILGLDFGLPVVRTNILNLDLYFDYSKIAGFGSGTAAGIKADVRGFGLVNISAKLERRFNNAGYIPSYFNSLYEIERFKLDTVNGTVTSKVQRLKNPESIGNGYYGELFVSVLNTFDILGSYQRLDKDPASGILHISSEVAPEGIPYVVRAGYDKINIKNEKDLFKLDDRSYLYFEFGYKPYEYLLVSMVYNWTFTPVRDADDNILRYEPQKRIEPRVSLIYPINFGGN